MFWFLTSKNKTPTLFPTCLYADLLCLLLVWHTVLGFYFGSLGVFNLIYKFGIYTGNIEEILVFSVINSNEVKLMTRDGSMLKRNKDTGYINKCISFVEEEYDWQNNGKLPPPCPPLPPTKNEQRPVIYFNENIS